MKINKEVISFFNPINPKKLSIKIIILLLVFKSGNIKVFNNGNIVKIPNVSAKAAKRSKKITAKLFMPAIWYE